MGDRRLVVIEEGDDFVKNYRGAAEVRAVTGEEIGVAVDGQFVALEYEAGEEGCGGGARFGLRSPQGSGSDSMDSGTCPDGPSAGDHTMLTAQLLVELGAGDRINTGDWNRNWRSWRHSSASRNRLVWKMSGSSWGSWKAETTWGMLDAIRDGNVDLALHLLDKLLTEGEHPLKLLGGINFTFRPLAAATETARQGLSLKESFLEAGVKQFVVESQRSRICRAWVVLVRNFSTADCWRSIRG